MCERLRYDWSEHGSLRATVIDSNISRPGSTWEIHASARVDGSTVEVIAVRRLRGARGWMLWPFFPTGLARREVAAYVRQFLASVEADVREDAAREPV